MDVQPTNLQQLRDAIMSIWTKISEQCFQHLVESMPRRIKAVLKAAKWGPTRYLQGVPNKVASECVYTHTHIYIYIYTVYIYIYSCISQKCIIKKYERSKHAKYNMSVY